VLARRLLPLAGAPPGASGLPEVRVWLALLSARRPSAGGFRGVS